jgi:hypothetical protein
LPLVAHVAHAHGGRVEVESEVGKGSTFTLRIPVGGRSTQGAGDMQAEAQPLTTQDPEGGKAP